MSVHPVRHSAQPIRRGPRSVLVPVRATAARTSAGARRGASLTRRIASEVGQGTVEYVGLLLLMATILAAIVGAAGGLGGNDKIGKKVVNQIGNSIDKAGGSSN